MLYIKTVEVEHVTTNVEKEIEMTNRYFWSSRSVYAIEFKKAQVKGNSEMLDEITLIQVKFEKNIILSSKHLFSKKSPLRISRTNEEWEQDLIHALFNEGYFENRTKEQFDSDFNAVINSLKSIRK